MSTSYLANIAITLRARAQVLDGPPQITIYHSFYYVEVAWETNNTLKPYIVKHINPTQARLKAEHEYLLLVSRTRTDEQGRRHSVAVPVIPPPPGVKFEGGYHIEKNPITGAARLVPPPQGDSKTQYFVKITSKIWRNTKRIKKHLLMLLRHTGVLNNRLRRT